MGSIPQVSVLKGLGGASLRRTKLHRILELNASKPEFQNSTALIYQDANGKTQKCSLSDLDAKANRLARAILSHTASASPNGDGDSPIAVVLPPSQSLVICLLAVWKAGGAYLPLDLCAPVERLKHILDEAKPLLVITDKDDSNGVYKSVKTISFSALQKDAEKYPACSVPCSEALPSSDIALVLYTSGSTGVSKGVRILHSAVLNRLQWQWREFPFGPEEDVCVFKTALTFVDSVSEIWAPLLNPQPRAVLIVPREVTKDPQRLIVLLEQYKIERLVLVPTLLRTILMYLKLSVDGAQLQKLRTWVCSGETLSVSLATEFVEYFNTGAHALCNFYGSTEIMGDVSYHVVRNIRDINYDGKVPIGVPVDNTVLYLLDKQLGVVPCGETGELHVAGRNLAAGYVNGRDAHRFIDNPHAVDPEHNCLFRTGDYAKIVKGTLLFEGRTDSQVKVRGHRVDLSEVETALAKIKGVQKSVALCYKPGEINQAVLAFVLMEGHIEGCDSDIENFLESHLPPYSIPQVVVVKKIPLLVNGKVDRQYLLRSYETLQNNNKENCDIDYSGVGMDKLNAAECLFGTVHSVLGSAVRGKVGSASNFYALGGNSLNSVFTVTQLRDRGYVISISEFISAKSLGEIVDKMMPINNIMNPTNQLSSTKFTSEPFNESIKEEVYRIITDSFYEKADLERWIEPPIDRKDYQELMDKMWEPLVDKKLSFVVKSASGAVIGASLNFDANDEPEVNITSKLIIVFDFLEYLEGPIRERKLPQGKGHILHSFMMGTKLSLSPAENVEVIQFMEAENIRLAKSRGFTGVFTTNTNPLTQQLGTDVFNYTVMHNYQVNQYVAPDGSRPFKNAADDQKVICHWKLI